MILPRLLLEATAERYPRGALPPAPCVSPLIDIWKEEDSEPPSSGETPWLLRNFGKYSWHDVRIGRSRTCDNNSFDARRRKIRVTLKDISDTNWGYSEFCGIFAKREIEIYKLYRYAKTNANDWTFLLLVKSEFSKVVVSGDSAGIRVRFDKREHDVSDSALIRRSCCQNEYFSIRADVQYYFALREHRCLAKRKKMDVVMVLTHATCL